jgi:hypothetical protein
MSKKPNHPIMELSVNQIPYCVGLTYWIVRGNNSKLIAILPPLIKNEAIMFFFALTVRVCPLLITLLKVETGIENKATLKMITRFYTN